MKRSAVEAAIREARKNFPDGMLPEWVDWDLTTWRERSKDPTMRLKSFLESGRGWDCTPFPIQGMTTNFARRGLTLLTITNTAAYCEKFMHILDGQVTPLHTHNFKEETIGVVRCVGPAEFVIALYNDRPDHSGPSRRKGEVIWVEIDGILRHVHSGQEIILPLGSNITLPARMWHLFWARGGSVVAHEVSKRNDDRGDNDFAQAVSRFARIRPDVPIVHPLCNELPRLLAA
jgi:D-lyxose ketol-isomerase